MKCPSKKKINKILQNIHFYNRVVIGRIFEIGTGLGDKHFMIHILGSAATELADNPKKYQKEQLTLFTPSEDRDFYFLKIKTTYSKTNKFQKKMLHI